MKLQLTHEQAELLANALKSYLARFNEGVPTTKVAAVNNVKGVLKTLQTNLEGDPRLPDAEPTSPLMQRRYWLRVSSRISDVIKQLEECEPKAVADEITELLKGAEKIASLRCSEIDKYVRKKQLLRR